MASISKIAFVVSRSKPARLRRPSVSHGLTLIEVIVTLAIVAIIAAIAIPNFSTNSPSAEANSLLGSLQFARMSAVKLGQPVVVCASTNGTSCNASGSSWSGGWIVFAPATATNPCAAAGGATGDVVLKAQGAFSSHDTAVFAAPSGQNNTVFCASRLGFFPAGYGGKVTINTSTGAVKQLRCMIVSGVGHTQVLSNGQTDVNGATCP